MAARSVYRMTERTPEQLAELKAKRERYQRERPGHEELIASGDYDGPFRHGDVMALLEALAVIQAERIRLGLSLEDISARSGMDKARSADSRRARPSTQRSGRSGNTRRRSA